MGLVGLLGAMAASVGSMFLFKAWVGALTQKRIDQGKIQLGPMQEWMIRSAPRRRRLGWAMVGIGIPLIGASLILR